MILHLFGSTSDESHGYFECSGTENGANRTGNVVDHHRNTRISNIAGYQTSETFLSGGIPEL